MRWTSTDHIARASPGYCAGCSGDGLLWGGNGLCVGDVEKVLASLGSGAVVKTRAYRLLLPDYSDFGFGLGWFALD